MTALVIALVLAAGLIALGAWGPKLVRAAGPSFRRRPRIAVGLLGTGIFLWIAAALSLAPLLVWAGTGPQILSDRASQICVSCLQATNPFASAQLPWAPPALLTISFSLLALAGLIAIGLVRLVRTERSTEQLSRDLHAQGESRTIAGATVLVVPDSRPLAFTFPARRGGIVLSTQTLHQLNENELAGVLAHEKAHLSQRHHLTSQILEALPLLVRRIPLVSATLQSIAELQEIAADNAAQREVDTATLASALLKMGGGSAPSMPAERQGVAVLNAAGSGRIQQLVGAHAGKTNFRPALALTLCFVLLGAAWLAICTPYLQALLQGCW